MRRKAAYHLQRAADWLQWLLAKAGGLDAEERAQGRREVRRHLLMARAHRAA